MMSLFDLASFYIIPDFIFDLLSDTIIKSLHPNQNIPFITYSQDFFLINKNNNKNNSYSCIFYLQAKELVHPRMTRVRLSHVRRNRPEAPKNGLGCLSRSTLVIKPLLNVYCKIIGMVITKSPVETECASDFLCDFLLFYLRHSSDLQLLYQVIHISCIYMALYDSLV